MRVLFKENNFTIRICEITDYTISYIEGVPYFKFKYNKEDYSFKCVNVTGQDWATLKRLADFDSIDLTIGWSRVTKETPSISTEEWLNVCVKLKAVQKRLKLTHEQMADIFGVPSNVIGELCNMFVSPMVKENVNYYNRLNITQFFI